MKYDVIIIGGGLGGLTAGAKLCKEGKKVLLIEQHWIPGGCATTFQRDGFTFEVGLHEMDGLDDKDMKTRIFRELGVFDKVEFPRIPEFYHFRNARVQITIPHDPGKAMKLLAGHFPKEEDGINAFFDQILNARKKAKEAQGKPEMSLGDFLDSILHDEDLKLVLLGNLGFFHDDPYSISLNYYSAAQGSYFRGGSNFIKGGSQQLSNYLSGYISQHGGEVILKHTVTDIITKDHKAVGVKYTESKTISSAIHTAYADEIIANAAIPNVVGMLPEEHREELQRQIDKREPGASLLTVYLGFKKNVKELGNKYYSTFVFDDSIKTQSDIKPNNHSDFPTRSFTFVDYSQVDSALAAEGKSVGVVCCIDYFADWDKLTPEEYLERKEKAGNVFIEKLEQLVPGIKDEIECYSVATPKTLQEYTWNPSGAVYGFAQTPERMQFDEIRSLEHLHFASAWTKIGGGFSGAIMSGYLCAVDVLRKSRGEAQPIHPV